MSLQSSWIFSGLLALALALTGWAADPVETRTVTLKWKPMAEAATYQIQIAPGISGQAAESAEFRASIDKTTTATQFSTRLKPGLYEFRIRGLSREGDPGLWSPLTPIRIVPRSGAGSDSAEWKKPKLKDLEVEFEYPDLLKFEKP